MFGEADAAGVPRRAGDGCGQGAGVEPQSHQTLVSRGVRAGQTGVSGVSAKAKSFLVQKLGYLYIANERNRFS